MPIRRRAPRRRGPCPGGSTARASPPRTWPWRRHGRRPGHDARRRVDAAGNVGGHDAAPRQPLIASIASRTTPRLPGEAGAQQGVDAPSAPCSARRRTGGRIAGQALQVDTARRRASRPGSAAASTRTSRPVSRSRRAATRPSPPLLPLPHTTTTGPGGHASSTNRARPAPARSIRSSEGTLLLDRPAVGRPHLLGVGERLEPLGQARAHTSTATAPAVVCGVGQRDPTSTPSSSARAAASPCSRSSGGVAPADDLDVVGAEHLEPERLDHRLLGAEARRQVLPRARAALRVGALRVGEQALGQARPALERSLEPLDLDDVDPHAAHGGRLYPPRGRSERGRPRRPGRQTGRPSSSRIRCAARTASSREFTSSLR